MMTSHYANMPGLPSDPAHPGILDGDVVSGEATEDATASDQTGMKSRERLSRRIQRISSSPPVNPGRPRAASSPYRLSASISCVSLASSPSPYAQPSVSFVFTHTPTSDPSSAATSIPGSPTRGSPACDAIGSILSIRKDAVHPSPAIGLPPDFGRKRSTFQWANVPAEMRIYIFSFLESKELVRVSRVSKEFHKICFDGQLWTRLDASEFYREIPAESLAKIAVAAGPFIRDLNLRGCVQMEHYKRAEIVVKACRNLVNATLEGCRNFKHTTLYVLLASNSKLASLNLTGLTAVTNKTCELISLHCPNLAMLNVSWCKEMDAYGVRMVIEACPKLRDLRAGEVQGFGNQDVAEVIFRTNRLERLVLAGCEDLTDASLKIMVHGLKPGLDVLTGRPMVEPRKLRHLDLSRCCLLTSEGVKALGFLVPLLEGLQLTRNLRVTDAGLAPILASAPHLTHLDVEDLADLTNAILSEHLAKAPCAPYLEHLNISYCERLGDSGMLPVLRSCKRLRSVLADNTRVSDLSLAEAASLVRTRAHRTTDRSLRPQAGLSMVVYDCQHVTWTGVREVLSRNAEVMTGLPQPGKDRQRVPTYPTEIISLKCFHSWQMTVDEHTKRVLCGDFAAANRLDRKWADYMQLNEEAGVGGSGGRRRRRRAREAQQVHADEEDGGTGLTAGRRRARTAGCVVM